MRFMAMASDSWASAEIEPNDMAPVQNRLTISLAGCTSSSGIDWPSAGSLNLQQPAKLAAGARVVVGVLGEPLVGVGVCRSRAATWMSAIACGSHMWRSPSARQWNSPGLGSSGGDGGVLGIAQRVAAERFLGEHVEVDALDAAGRAGEAAVDHFVAQADGLEDLGALVALQRRDAHLGHDLEHALGDAGAVLVHQIVVGGGDGVVGFAVGDGFDRRVVVALARLVALDAFLAGVEQPVAAGLPQRLERQVRVDRVGAVADEQAVVMHLAGFASFDDDADAGALLLAARGGGARRRWPAAS